MSNYGYFTFKQKKSIDYDLYLDPNFSLTSPEISGTFEEIPGKDGEVFVPDHHLKNVTKSFGAYLLSSPTKGSFEQAKDISNWLKSTTEWSELTFSGDPDYVYKALFVESFDILVNIETYNKTILNFVIKPYKYLKTGLVEIGIKNGGELVNKGTRPSKPLIKIKGSGDIEVNFGGEKITLKGIDREITLDCLHQTALGPNGHPAYDKVYTYPFPNLPTGRYYVQFTGNVTSLAVIPRWEVLV